MKSGEKLKDKGPILAIENRNNVEFQLCGKPAQMPIEPQFPSFSNFVENAPPTDVILQIIPHDYPSEFMSTQEIAALENSYGCSTVGLKEKLRSVRKLNDNLD